MTEQAAELGILARRRIEAEIIKPIWQILVRELGHDRAAAIIDEAVTHAALEAARGFAGREANGTSLKSFVALLPLWEKDGALEIEVVGGDGEHAHDFNVRRCRYAETYREMGLGEIGHLLSCNRDAAFIAGYAPGVEFQRTQTLMAGASHCDFRYRQTESGPEPVSGGE